MQQGAGGGQEGSSGTPTGHPADGGRFSPYPFGQQRVHLLVWWFWGFFSPYSIARGSLEQAGTPACVFGVHRR